ncbi:hypothetical protein A8H39_20590 [Paraburkholderia fungorum]|uniref:hypothetical protein n=1 Tax=Paraburkholderia fungorum TaxID=134537 RepID=UPI0004817C17
MRDAVAPLTMIDRTQFEERLNAAECTAWDSVLDGAEKALGKLLPRGFKRPEIDSRDDALWSLRFACEVSGLTEFGDSHPWNRRDVVAAIKAADSVKLRPFVKRMARIAFWSKYRLLYMPPGVRPPMWRLLEEGEDPPPPSGLRAAVPMAEAQPADDDGHPLGVLHRLRALFDAQDPALQADVIAFVDLVYGSHPDWMVPRVAKRRGRPAGSKQRTHAERAAAATKKSRKTLTEDERKANARKHWNGRVLDTRRKTGFVADAVLEMRAMDDAELFELLDMLGADDAGTFDLEIAWKHVENTSTLKLYAAMIAYRCPLPLLTPETSANVLPRPWRVRLLESRC